MSNLSDIGFPVQNEQDVNVLITETIKYVESIRCPRGFYLRFSDSSGAEIYLQGNVEQELIGFNPHFAGKSRIKVGLIKLIERDSSELDGGFQAWANPLDETAESGEYQFVFDVPEFRLNDGLDFPLIQEIQLTAFASNDFKVFNNEAAFYYGQDAETQMSAKSFFSSGLFLTTDSLIPVESARPISIISGEIVEFELKTNELSGEKFYRFLIDTLGGEIDVVTDVKLVPNEPKIGGIVSGQFWLSGKLISD
ncbi:MAG: hypothetical protein ABI686_15170 [Acidobacteriota bacterium]